ncbi:Sperm acrosome membrane-associated protein 1 [Acipenser ruthenus]|uniref:Sperm acrosome membrane-associated protein 1 n=1 Tax=Acipenser ruthenus TaxID=7906 RepID=A0A662YTV7_ACIRT|nr:Sperm acrosome membrane-associated protein 1 [Acipenser ruthenus]
MSTQFEEHLNPADTVIGPCSVTCDGSVVPRGRTKALLYCATIKSAFRFTYRWQRIEDNKEPLTLENTRSVIEVRRKNYPVDYQCDTYENDSLTSTVRFTVHESLGMYTWFHEMDTSFH